MCVRIRQGGGEKDDQKQHKMCSYRDGQGNNWENTHKNQMLSRTIKTKKDSQC